jgi:hypothetical protein
MFEKETHMNECKCSACEQVDINGLPRKHFLRSIGAAAAISPKLEGRTIATYALTFIGTGERSKLSIQIK